MAIENIKYCSMSRVGICARLINLWITGDDVSQQTRVRNSKPTVCVHSILNQVYGQSCTYLEPELGLFSACLIVPGHHQAQWWLQIHTCFLLIRTLTHWGRDNVFKWIFLNENIWISIKIPLKFVPRDPISNIPALAQIMAWRRPGDKPLSEPMTVSLLTHICVTRPQWVKIGYTLCLS